MSTPTMSIKKGFHQEELQGLSKYTGAFQQRHECVGTLLLPQTTLQALPTTTPSLVVRRLSRRVVNAVNTYGESTIDSDGDSLRWQS